MKKTKALTAKLLEELERTPLVESACEKVGISRNTFYRWMKEDKRFLKQASEALSLGAGRVNDIAVSNILSGIKAKDMKATMYWLGHNHPNFRRPYRDRIDADDFLQYKRILDEKSQVFRAEIEARELANQMDEEKRKAAIKRITDFQDKWFVNEDAEIERKAQKRFEELKKEFLDGKDPII